MLPLALPANLTILSSYRLGPETRLETDLPEGISAAVLLPLHWRCNRGGWGKGEEFGGFSFWKRQRLSSFEASKRLACKVERDNLKIKFVE